MPEELFTHVIGRAAIERADRAAQLEGREANFADVLLAWAPYRRPIGLSVVSNKSDEMLTFVREHGVEGVVAKRRVSIYQPGKRSGLWAKHRINLGQEFVIGGYTPGSNGFDAIIIGFYRGDDLIYAGRVRAGFVPASRQEVFAQITDLKTTVCPFSNLPETAAGRRGQGLMAANMNECVWLQPSAVARVDFLE